jgi:transaldolase
MYVTELVTRGVVNTMPRKTMEAMAEHGTVTGDTVRGSYDDARAVLDALERLGISYGDVTAQLEREGVEKFDKSWAELLSSVSDELARVSSSDSAAEAGQ